MATKGWEEGAALITAMLRIWSAARSIGENARPRMRAHVAAIEPSPEFVSACDSLFALTEAVLGRRLVTARCCCAKLSTDEAAMLAVLRHAPMSGSVVTSATVPHGLPGALRWSAFAVLRALDDSFDLDDLKPENPVPDRCPFNGRDLDRAA